MEELDLNRRAREIGDRIRRRFSALQERVTALADVRGLGAMIGAEFCHQGDPSRPASAEVADVLRACLEHGVLAISAGTHGNVIRILSPLVITDAELDRGLDIMEEAVLRVFATPAATPASGTARPQTAGR
jgi:4-aminobutyrate aminotransferase/(S)-3-amino-2-methylpropionate transaminase